MSERGENIGRRAQVEAAAPRVGTIDWLVLNLAVTVAAGVLVTMIVDELRSRRPR